MKEKGLAYAIAIGKSTLQRGECSMDYGAYYLPSLAYGTPATILSYKECEDVQRAVLAAILPKMGIVRNAARKFVFGSVKYCGLGLDHLATIQNYSRLRLSNNRQMNVVKLCHNYWHTGSRHVRFYGGERPCCFCQETKEDRRHILNCPSLDASYHRDALWQKVKNDMQMWRLPADFWTAIEKGPHHLPSDLKEPTIPTLPFQISVNPIRNHLRVAFQEQHSIKWSNLLKGRMSHRWQQFATAHVRSKKLDLRAQEWGPKFITALWDHSL
jgi:hypothetical protein